MSHARPVLAADETAQFSPLDAQVASGICKSWMHSEPPTDVWLIAALISLRSKIF